MFLLLPHRKMYDTGQIKMHQLGLGNVGLSFNPVYKVMNEMGSTGSILAFFGQ